MMLSLSKFLQLLVTTSICLFLIVPTGFALAPQDLPAAPPDEAVLDTAEVLSRAGRNEIESRLKQLEPLRVDAKIITLRRLDYGLSLTGFGEDLVKRWSGDHVIYGAAASRQEFANGSCDLDESTARRAGH